MHLQCEIVREKGLRGTFTLVMWSAHLMWLLLLLLLLHTRLLEEEHALELGKTCKLGQGLRLL